MAARLGTTRPLRGSRRLIRHFLVHRLGGEEGKADAERRSATRRLEHLDVAVVVRHDAGDDREAEAAAAGVARARGVGAPEALEDLLAQLRRDALAVVDDRDRAVAARAVDLDDELDRAVIRGEP